MARGSKLSLSSVKRGGVYRKFHLYRRFINFDNRKPNRMLIISNRFSNFHSLNSGNRHNVARFHFLNFHATQSVKYHNRRGFSFRLLSISSYLHNPHTSFHISRYERTYGYLPLIFVIKNIYHEHLHRFCFIRERRGNFFYDHIKERLYVLHMFQLILFSRLPLNRGGIENGKVCLFIACSQLHEKVKCFV